MIGLLTSPEQLLPKPLMPLWRNDFSFERRRSKGAPSIVGPMAFDVLDGKFLLCLQGCGARRELVGEVGI